MANPVVESAAQGASAAFPGFAERLPSVVPDGGVPWAAVALLVFLVALSLAARWWARRAGPGRPSATSWRRARAGAHDVPPSPRIFAAGALDMRTRLVIVEWQGRRLLVACGAGTAPMVLIRESLAACEAGESGASSE